jgi:uncharacterized protein YjiS (DUF1127 family)
MQAAVQESPAPVLLGPDAPQSSPLARPGRRAAQAMRGVAAAYVRWRRWEDEREALRALSERDLRDIGLTRADVLVEIDKPFWRI